MKVLKVMWAGLIAVAVSGCVDVQSTVRLKADGSGTVTVEQYMSPQMTGMMESMAGMTQAATTNAPAAKVDALAMFEDMITQEIKGLGETATLVSKEASTNAQGWKGFKLVCAFKDINKLNLSGVGNMEGPGEEKDAAKSKMQVSFKPGKPAKLVVTEPEPPATTEAAPAQPEGMDQQAMMQMMAPMMAGMRMRMAIEVDGKIVKTNAQYVEGNRVVLADITMDKVLANPEGAKLITAAQNDPKAIEKLAALKIEGVKISTEKKLEIEFQ